MDTKFIIDISIIILGFIVLNQYKYTFSEKVNQLFRKHIFLIAVLLCIPFILIEESINCIDWNDGSGCRMTLWINIILFLQIFITLFITRKLQLMNVWKILGTYSIFGVSWEILFGGLQALLFSPFLLFIIPYVMISYAFIAIIPITIMVVSNRNLLK